MTFPWLAGVPGLEPLGDFGAEAVGVSSPAAVVGESDDDENALFIDDNWANDDAAAAGIQQGEFVHPVHVEVFLGPVHHPVKQTGEASQLLTGDDVAAEAQQ